MPICDQMRERMQARDCDRGASVELPAIHGEYREFDCV